MLNRRLKRQVFLLEWLNIYAICFYFDFLFFFMRQEFGFGNRENLILAAVNGFFYVIASWYGGKFAQKHGYFLSLKIGFVMLAVSLGVGAMLDSVVAQVIILVAWTLGTCFTWPSLEALVSENEDRPGLARMIGIYNLTWASGAAVAYFTGGTLLQHLGPRSLFVLPAVLHSIQLVLCLRLESVARATAGSQPQHRHGDESHPHPVSPQVAKAFLLMAWVANPFAYIAMNTVIPLLPDVAAKLHLSTQAAGFVGSVWKFARLAAFLILWRWEGWHYRFNWLIGSFVLMIAGFVFVLLSPTLATVVLAQIVFGLCVGLIYYSSLFYSMDVGETKGEHGGFHEALIGVGLFAGPALGAGSLWLLSDVPRAGIWGVGTLLTAGLATLVVMYSRNISRHEK